MDMKRILFFACLATSVASAQSTGTFTWIGSMTEARTEHTATLLANGKVLIAGGTQDLVHGTASAELYDPKLGTFTATGSMTEPRLGHMAALLPDGTVLIAGGGNDGSFERYDPTTGIFRAAGSVGPIQGSAWGAAMLLNTGQVLVAIGNVAALFDPASGTITPTGKMVYQHASPAAILLADRRVLFAESLNYCGNGPATCGGGDEIYDPATGSFAATGQLPWFDDSGSTFNELASGQVLMAGGITDYGILTAGYLYDPRAGGFSATASMKLNRFGASGTLLPDGTVLIAGGGDGTNFLPAAELYIPSTGTFAPTGDMTIGRADFASTVLADGSVLVTGGAYGWNHALVNADIYRPSTLVPSPVLSAVWSPVTGQFSSITPVSVGDVLSVYTTGLIEGGALPPQIAIGGKMAEVLYFGDAPGYPGYFQVNFRVPPGVTTGSNVPVQLNYLSRPSNAVLIGVK
jgi:hypothetical protein